MKLKKGDQVQIMSGKDRGKRGAILRIFPKISKILVEGANMMKRHRKAKNENEKGERVEIAVPLHVSNAMLVDQKTGKPGRIGYKHNGKEKLRVSKKSGETIS